MTNIKMTKKEMYSVLIQLVKGDIPTDALTEIDVELLTEKLEHELELLAKKSSGTGKAKVDKNAELKTQLVEYLTEQGKAMRVCEIIADPKFPLSQSKVTRALSDMVKEGRVIRTEVKKVAYFGV